MFIFIFTYCILKWVGICPYFQSFLTWFLHQVFPNTQVLSDSYCSRLLFPGFLLPMLRLSLINNNKITVYC